MITDSNQACLDKVIVRRLQEESYELLPQYLGVDLNPQKERLSCQYNKMGTKEKRALSDLQIVIYWVWKKECADRY